VIGDGDRRHSQIRDSLAEFRQPVGAVEQGVLAVKVEMDEVAGHLPILRHFDAQLMSDAPSEKS
jgi:hypothetical protein